MAAAGIVAEYNPFHTGHHVGIVVNVENGFINTIEGNSSNKVQRGRYATGDRSIYGYGVVMY